MKNKILFPLVLLMLSAFSFGQKFAYVDTEYILKNIPSYKAAQEKLDKMSDGWQKEVEAKYADVEKLYKSYQAEKVLLTDDMKKKKEDDIMSKEKEAKELQRKYFGPEGELFKKRQELVKPLQDDVYKAVKDLASDGSYALIFDSSSGASILFSDPKLDKSDEILKKMGYKN